jgi:TonB family protein
MSISVGKEYVPTIINSHPLPARLALELSSLQQDFRHAWPEFKKRPVESVIEIIRKEIERASRVLVAPNVLAACAIVVCIVAAALLVDRTRLKANPTGNENSDIAMEIKILNFSPPDKKPSDDSIGREGHGRVGFNEGTGEGSGAIRQQAQGGGSGGEHEPLPPQNGKVPPPSSILASIPKTPPLHSPSLPVAGIDIDPALWKDVKTPAFGDPRSNSTAPSKGPGEGGGIGTNNGLGIGEGNGPGFGPGTNGNMGNGDKQTGCCVGGAASDDGNWNNRIITGNDVEHRAQLLLKPEPQYTEEARRNQITGTVMLKVVFSSAGQVEQIRAVHTLPFGLTEKAIAAARQIKFVPATKGGHPVSVWMQLEYNFNLY